VSTFEFVDFAITYCSWKDYQINIIDTNNYYYHDFIDDVQKAVHVVDGGVLVLSSVLCYGVGREYKTIDEHMKAYEIPRLVFIDNLDAKRANPWEVLNQTRSMLGHHSAAIQVPIDLEDDFKGLVDLVQLKAYFFHGENVVVVEEVPADMEALVLDKMRELIKIVSEVDGKLAEAFHSDKPISSAELEEAV
jgi:elongation factor G